MSTYDHEYALIILYPILAAVATISVTLRLWSRYVTPGDCFDWEDVYILASLAFLLGDIGSILAWRGLDHEQGVTAGIYAYVAYILFVLALSVPKFAVLSFYNRIFSTSHTKFHVVVNIFRVANLVLTVLYTLLSIFGCTPVQKQWKPDVPGTCLSQYAVFVSFGALSIVLDLGILIMPLPPVFQLQVTNKRKILLLSIFIIGYSVAGLAIARTIVVAVTFNQFHTDYISTLIPFLSIAATEAAVSVTGASVPMIYHLFVQIHKGGWESVVQKKHFGRNNRVTKASIESGSGSGFESSKSRGSNPY